MQHRLFFPIVLAVFLPVACRAVQHQSAQPAGIPAQDDRARTAPSGEPVFQEDDRPGIAVLPFTNGGSFGPDRENLELYTVGIQGMLLTELRQNSALRIIERKGLRELLDELDLLESGVVDARTAAQVGKIVGARYVIMGVFMDNFGRFRLDGRVVDVETSEIPVTASVTGTREDLYELLFDLAVQITDDVDLPPLPAAIRDERGTRDTPPQEGLNLYWRALIDVDFGRYDQAEEKLRQLAVEFPQMTEERAELQQQISGD